jgi:sugar phosphate isomerase/epimerase
MNWKGTQMTATGRGLPRTAVQLYTLRDVPDPDLLSVIPILAGFGYAGVELVGADLGRHDVESVSKALDDWGMVASSAHLGLGQSGLDEHALDDLQTLGVDTVVVPFLPPDDFADLDAVSRAAVKLNRAAQQVAGRGLAFAYHNHFWELQSVIDDKPALLHLFDQADPMVSSELDVYWAQVGGADPASLLGGLGDRAQLLHVKDGPANRPEEAMVAVGSGSVDIPAVLKANGAVRWHIVELDRCDTDMYEAVEQSHRYLMELGLSAPRRS